MKYLFNILLGGLCSLMVVSCNKIDNYEAPNGGVYGQILDEKTNEPIPLAVEGQSGVMVTLTEIGTDASAPITFRAKQDGSYENSKLFNGYYRVVLSNCPLVGAPQAHVQVKDQTEANILATPYARLTATASISDDNQVTVNYDVETADPSFKLSNVKVMWNYAPGVDVNNANYAGIATKSADASGSHVFALLDDKQYIENHYKIVANGGKIYVRVAATTTVGSFTNTNYSKVVELTIK